MAKVKKASPNQAKFLVRGAATVITIMPSRPRTRTVMGAYKRDVERLRGDFIRAKKRLIPVTQHD